MTHAAFVFTGWGVALVTLALYVRWVLARGRSLSPRVPPEQRRWT